MFVVGDLGDMEGWWVWGGGGVCASGRGDSVGVGVGSPQRACLIDRSLAEPGVVFYAWCLNGTVV